MLCLVKMCIPSLLVLIASLLLLLKNAYSYVVNQFIFSCFSLKTSLLKWRPDYEIAADEYSKAGNVMQVVGWRVLYLF
jgi:hypothetical protein